MRMLSVSCLGRVSVFRHFPDVQPSEDGWIVLKGYATMVGYDDLDFVEEHRNGLVLIDL